MLRFPLQRIVYAHVIWSAIFLSTALSIASQVNAEPEQTPEVLKTDYFSMITSEKISTLSGLPVEAETLRGHPLLVHLWAPWCVVCLPELAELQKLQTQVKNDSIRIVTIASLSSIDDTKSIVEPPQYSFVTLLDKKGTIYNTFNDAGVPLTFFLNSSGKVVSLKDPKDHEFKDYLVGPRNWLEASTITEIRTIK